MKQYKRITAANGRYSVNPEGCIYSHITNRVLRPGRTTRGYLFVALRIEGKAQNRFIHRLVAQAFLPNPLGLPEVNHKNGIKADCRRENLEWVTHAQNMQHAYATGLTPKPPTMQGRFGADHNRSKAVFAYAPNGSNIGTYGNARQAAEALGLKPPTVSQAVYKGHLAKKKTILFSYNKLGTLEAKQRFN